MSYDRYTSEFCGGGLMTFTKSRFVNFDEYLMADPGDLPEGFYEYWNGELVPVMSESIGNDAIANFIFLMLIQIGVPIKLIRPHSCEVVVPGKPRTRLPDLTVLDEIHLTLLKKRATITQTMPPPRIVMEVVSPGNETSDNYLRDYRDKPDQYAAIGIPEFWRIDPERKWVQVGTLVDAAYQFRMFRDQEIIISPLLEPLNLNLTVAQVLEAGE